MTNGATNPAVAIRLGSALVRSPDLKALPFRDLAVMEQSVANEIAVKTDISNIAACADDSPRKFRYGEMDATSLLPHNVARRGNRERRAIDKVTPAEK